MSDRFVGRVLRYIKEQNLFRQGDRVIAAFSGGADSVCLLFCLYKLAPRLGVTVEAVHVHHGLRGTEADEDAAFARDFCEKRGIPFVCRRIPEGELASAAGLSLEEAARKRRYEILQEEAARQGSDEPYGDERYGDVQHGDRRYGDGRYSDGQYDDRRYGDGQHGDRRYGDGQYGGQDRARAWIAVAHHRDDQAETVLLNLFRGSGIEGLSGMQPKRANIVRPLLFAWRSEIEDCLRREGLCWRTDSTNFEDDQTRNRVRNHLLPYVKDEINARAAEHLAALAEDAGEVTEYLEEAAAQWVESACVFMGTPLPKERSYIDNCELIQGNHPQPQIQARWQAKPQTQAKLQAKLQAKWQAKSQTQAKLQAKSQAKPQAKWQAEAQAEAQAKAQMYAQIMIGISFMKTAPPLVVRLGLRQILARLSGSRKDIGRVHLNALFGLADRRVGSHLDLPYGIAADRGYEEIRLTQMAAAESFTDDSRASTARPANPPSSQPATPSAIWQIVPGTTQTLESHGRLTTRIFAPPEDFFDKIPKKIYTKWFDYDKIKNGLVARFRQTGDALYLKGVGTKTVKSLMIDLRVPAAERGIVPLLVSGDEVIWVIGYRGSDAYLVTQETKRILEAVWEP